MVIMDSIENQNDTMAATYDDEAEACGWFGPEVAFGLTYKYVQAGQSILDIGIGTGLGIYSIPKSRAGSLWYGHFPRDA
jgi:hypothetical protein